MDCHETLHVSRNDTMITPPSLRGSVADEAIYNVAYLALPALLLLCGLWQIKAVLTQRFYAFPFFKAKNEGFYARCV